MSHSISQGLKLLMYRDYTDSDALVTRNLGGRGKHVEWPQEGTEVPCDSHSFLWDNNKKEKSFFVAYHYTDYPKNWLLKAFLRIVQATTQFLCIL